MQGYQMTKKETKTKALYITESQPPHLGELISLLSVINDYDIIAICVNGNTKVMPIQHVLSTWVFLTQPYKDKIVTCASTDNFSTVAKLPEEFKDYTVLTTSDEVFAHLSSLNVTVRLIPRAKGYWPVFERVAYRQGLALEWLKTNVIRR